MAHTGGDWLPMPYERQRRLWPSEWYAYHDRQGRHHKRHPAYVSGWRRPTVPTAEKVWALVTEASPDLKIDDFLPGHEWLTPDENDALRVQAMQAFVVALDDVLLLGERGKQLTFNGVFDALARHWSDTYRAVREARRADVSWDMTRDTVRASLRDLLRNGLRLDVTWNALRDGIPGLYSTERIAKQGFKIAFEKDARLRRQLVDIIEDDLVYQRHQSAHPRLLPASEDLPQQETRRETAAEWDYNVVELGLKSRETLQRLEDTRLYLHVPSFLEDMERLEARRDELANRVPDDGSIAAMKAECEKIEGQLLQHEGVRRRLQSITPDADGCIEIKSGFFKGAFGRYYAAHLWPSEVTGKSESEVPTLITPGVRSELWERSTRRGRWFFADATPFDKPGWGWEGAEEWQDEFTGDRRPLVGVDVSASQFQVLAIFCGLRNFERELVGATEPLKVTLATEALRRARDPRDDFWLPDEYTNANVEQLQGALKLAARNFAYGSPPKNIVQELRKMGFNLGDGANLERLLKPTSVWQLTTTYLPVCVAAADAAYVLNPFAGFQFTDPYDGARIRWNPIKRRKDDGVGSSSGLMKVYVHTPKSKRDTASGDYRVNHRWGDDALRRKVAPCLAHVLDTMFAALVIERLHALGVRDIVHIHDSWLVVSNALPALDEAVKAAGGLWLQKLGPAYRALEHYLPAGTEYGDRVRDWRRQWQLRVAACKAGREDWPRFRVDPTKLVWLEVKKIHKKRGEGT